MSKPKPKTKSEPKPAPKPDPKPTDTTKPRSARPARSFGAAPRDLQASAGGNYVTKHQARPGGDDDEEELT